MDEQQGEDNQQANSTPDENNEEHKDQTEDNSENSEQSNDNQENQGQSEEQSSDESENAENEPENNQGESSELAESSDSQEEKPVEESPDDSKVADAEGEASSGSGAIPVTVGVVAEAANEPEAEQTSEQVSFDPEPAPAVVEPQVFRPEEQKSDGPDDTNVSADPEEEKVEVDSMTTGQTSVSDQAPVASVVPDVIAETSVAAAANTVDSGISPTEPAMSATPSAAAKHSGRSAKKLVMMIGLPILILIVLGGAVLGGYAYYQINKPENVLLQAVAYSFDGLIRDEAAEVDSFVIEGDIKVTTGEESFPINIDLNAVLDLNGQNNEIGVSADFGLFKAGVDVGIFGEEAFVKVSGLELVGGLLLADSPEIAGLLGQVNDQWISIENSIIEQAGFSLSEGQQLTESERDQMTSAFMDHRFVEFVEELESGDVNGVDSHRYKARFNSEELKAWIQKVKDINGEAVGVDDALVEMVGQLGDAIDAADYDMEIWIGKSDKYIRRITATVRDNNTTIDIDLKMSQYNEVQAPTKPTDAISLGELILSITPLLESGGLDLGGLLESSGLVPQDTTPADATLESNSLLRPSSGSEFPSFTLGETDNNL